MAFIEKSSNPAFSSKLFDKQGFAAEGQRMTVQGTVNKSLILFVCTIIPAYYVFDMFLAGSGTTSFLLIGGIGGFIAALVTIFKPTVAPISAPIYAALEGLFLGGVSALAESMYPGICFSSGNFNLWDNVCDAFCLQIGFNKSYRETKVWHNSSHGCNFRGVYDQFCHVYVRFKYANDARRWAYGNWI